MLDASSPFASFQAPPGPASLIDLAARRLRQAIVSCELAPGDFVNEASLSERFGLGRAGVRVALTALAAAGFIARHARQGWRIAPVGGALAEAVLDARRRLEPSLAEARLSAADGAALRQLCEMAASAEGRPEHAALAVARAADRQIRNRLAAHAGPIAARWLDDVWDHADRITRSLDLAGHSIAGAAWAPAIEALVARDRSAAASAIRGEIERFAVAVARGLMATEARRSKPLMRSARRRRGKKGGAMTASASGSSHLQEKQR
ncbi:MAG: hypothetical protein BGP06_04405 [Rhizobiales bacterium 65-9]|nr:GntR family transcriptional regulator [Hyphomicrobiales bacterium]OJY32445.1 MAG: hypothetical protein BGP06_04405 [Rhizobiales bacterium 65-9]